jgi:carboxypeptidase Q
MYMSDVIERSLVGEIFAASEVWENMQVLADDIGSRLAGSAGEIEARDFLVASLERYGVDEVRVEPFVHRAWHTTLEKLHVVAPLEREIACRCAGLSPSIEDLEADVVFLERCDVEELEARSDEVKGRMVIAPYYPVPRQLKVPLAARYGAVALLEARSSAGGLQPARTCAFARMGDIPTASISKEDAAYLRRVKERKGRLKLRLSLHSHLELKDSWNVVGYLHGTAATGEHIALGAHYDSWHVGTGAVDNASGVVAVLEAARALAQYKKHLSRGVRFVFFGVEEFGLVGSWAYTKVHAGELEDAILMVNNDVVGRPSRLVSAGFAELCPALERIASRAHRRDAAGPITVAAGNPTWALDLFPFVAAGVPAIGIGCEMADPEASRYMHTRADTADKVDAQGLTECAAINAQIAYAFANLPARPAARKTRAEIEALLQQCEMFDALDVLAVWPPERVLQRYFEEGV